VGLTRQGMNAPLLPQQTYGPGSVSKPPRRLGDPAGLAARARGQALSRTRRKEPTMDDTLSGKRIAFLDTEGVEQRGAG
jgi:hypothetical protein